MRGPRENGDHVAHVLLVTGVLLIDHLFHYFVLLGEEIIFAFTAVGWFSAGQNNTKNERSNKQKRYGGASFCKDNMHHIRS